MSRNPSFSELRALLDEVALRYEKARAGYEFDFTEEIEPFLKRNEETVMSIRNMKTDFRFNAATREKAEEEFMELLMACHMRRFSKKVYREKYKFLNMWLAHAKREALFGCGH